MKVFVYGSLKKGFGNHTLLKDAEFVCSEMLTGYSMSDLGFFPMAYPDPDGCIFGEIYYITPEILEDLDNLEGEGVFYKRIVESGEREEFFFVYVGIQVDRLRKDEINFWKKG